MSRRELVVNWIISRIADLCDVDPATIAPDASFAGIGLSSLQALELSDDLQQWIGLPLPPTLAYDYPTIGQAADHLVEQTTSRPTPARDEPDVGDHLSGVEPVAIVGIGCRVPGANGTAQFWRLLCDGVDAISEVPPDRWQPAAPRHPASSSGGPASMRWGGFLADVDAFDPGFFAISTREAARMDPQQRIVLEVTIEALQDAGIATGSLAGSATAVFLGASTFDHGAAVLGTHDGLQPHDGTGIALSVIANRVSYCLDLHGRSMVIDTACSSSLVAVQLACEALHVGRTDLAIAGGVNVITSPRIAQSFSAGGLMAADGRCKPFDHRADGYVRSEGAGVVVLKPLSRALGDGDRVYAVILGGAVNQDGRTNGMTAPSRPAQEAVLEAAYQAAGIDRTDVDYVEAHGTGTAVGDSIEVGAIIGALTAGRPHSRPLLIGSVKSNFGHLEAAAGVTGLIKTALALHYGRIPGTVHFERASPLLGLDSQPIEVVTRLTSFPERAGAIAGVSSFGFGGTNAHVVLAAAPTPAREARPVEQEAFADQETPVLLPVSAPSQMALITRAGAWAEHAHAHLSEPGWSRRAAAAAALRADHHRHRLAMVVSGNVDVAAGMAAAACGERLPGVSGPREIGRRPPRIALVFPGQGSQWQGMGRELARHVPAFRNAIRECSAVISRWLEHPLWADEDGLVADGTHAVQPALFAIQVAIARTWMAWGLEPAAVVGHSMGEIAAAHICGALSLDDAARIVCERSRLLARISGMGGLALVELSRDEATDLVAARGDAVTLAAVNGPRAIVLSGSDDALDHLLATLAERGVFTRRIAVEFAAHSAQVEPLLPDLAGALAKIAPGAETIPLYSTVTGLPISGTELDPGYWTRNVRAPVLFGPALTNMIEDGYDAFLEISPHPVLTRAIAESLHDNGSAAVVLSSMRDDGELRGMLGTLGDFFTLGGRVNWAAVYATATVAQLDLPPHDWEHTRFPIARVGSPAPPAWAGMRAGRLSMPQVRVNADPTLRLWPLRVDLRARPELADHVVADTAVVPAAYWLTAMAEAASDTFGTDAVVIENAVFAQALAADAGSDVQLALRADGGSSHHAAIVSIAEEGQPVTHSAGMVRVPVPDERPAAIDIDALMAQCTADVPVAGLYERLATAGLRYGDRFRGLSQLWAGAGQALGLVRTPQDLDDAGTWPLHPALLDTCLHTVAAALEKGDELGALPLPVGVAAVWASRPASAWRQGWCHARVTGSAAVQGQEITADVVVVDDNGEPIWYAEGFRVRLVTGERKIQDGRLYDLAWLPVQVARRAKFTGDWLVISDGDGIGEALAGRLAAAGARCRVQKADAEKESPDLGADLTGIVDTRALAHSAAGAGAINDITGAALRLAQAIGRGRWRDRPPRLWLLTRAADEATLASATLWGLGHTVANEYRGSGCSVVDLHSPVDDLDLVCSALALADPPCHLAVRGPQLLAPRLVRSAAGSSQLTAARPDHDYVITGGLGGLGRQVARWLARRGARHLLLAGRGAPSPDAELVIRDLVDQGVEVRQARIDVANAAGLRAALRPDGSRRPIAGVFHLAGVLEDALVADLDPVALHRALAGKAVGAWNLHDLIRDEPIEEFVLFSSLAGLMGSPGQAAYAAANTFLDALAQHRARLGLPAVSIAWGPWAGESLAVRAGGVGRLADRGVPPLRPEVGLDLLERAISSGRPNVSAAAFAPGELSRIAGWPVASQLLGTLIETGSGQGGPERGSARLDVLAAPVGERASVMMRFLLRQLANVLGTTEAPVAPEVPFQALGLDSLLSIELRDRLEIGLGLRLSATLVYANPTAHALANALLDQVTPATPVTGQPDVRTGGPAEAADLSALDDEQIGALLSAELET